MLPTVRRAGTAGTLARAMTRGPDSAARGADGSQFPGSPTTWRGGLAPSAVPAAGSAGRPQSAGMAVKQGTAQAGHGRVFGVYFWSSGDLAAGSGPRLAAGAGRRAHDQRGSGAG